jgi:hypothetical protein
MVVVRHSWTVLLIFVCCVAVPSVRAWLVASSLEASHLSRIRAPNPSRRTRHQNPFSSLRSPTPTQRPYHLGNNRISHSSSKLYASTTESSALSTTRLPLTRIFNGGREYLFTTRRNVRSFEWSTTELEDLFESILSLDGINDDLELNAITILPADISDEEQRNIGITSRIYDVNITVL